MIGGLTYGAKAAEAESHIKTALKLTPDSPIAHIEHGNVLMLLHGEKKEDAAAAAYEKATKIKPLDAMEALAAAYAKSQLAERGGCLMGRAEERGGGEEGVRRGG